MRIVIIGSGYVGLVTAACLAESGFRVTCIDKNAEKIEQLNQGHLPLFESGLEELISNNLFSGNLTFTTHYESPISHADIIFITAGTPQKEGEKELDLSDVTSVHKKIASCLSSAYKVIVMKSTLPVGSTRKLSRFVGSINPEANVDFISNPEFLRAGSAIKDFMNPDRIVLGSDSKRAVSLLSEMYKSFLPNCVPTLETSIESAELIKQASNTFLATKLAFFNQLSDISEAYGADIRDVTKGLSYDPRIGGEYMDPGPGLGGSCLVKDTQSLIQTGALKGVDLSIARESIAANKKRKASLEKRVVKACGGSVEGKSLAVLGLTFKADTDDLRESPSLSLIPALVALGAEIRAYDPHGMSSASHFLPNIYYGIDEYDVLENADALVILTNWDSFKTLDIERVKSLLKTPTIIDFRNLFSAEKMKDFNYLPLGYRVDSRITSVQLEEPFKLRSSNG